MHRLLFFLGFMACLAATGDVRADDTRDGPSPTIVTKKSWYGWQPLTCDALAATSFIVGAETERDNSTDIFFMRRELVVTGLTLYLACGPVVHLFHHHPTRALGDFALRFLMPASTIVAGVVADDRTISHDSDDIQLWTYLGIFAGVWTMAAAVAVDATIMSREEKHVALEPNASRSPVIFPDFSVRRGGGTLGLRGSF